MKRGGQMWQPSQEEINELKQINQQKGAKHDDHYRVMAPLLLEFTEGHCNRKFDSSNLPAGIRIFIAKAIKHNQIPTGLTSRSMGSVSYSYDLEFPDSMYSLIRQYKRVKFRALR